MAVMPEYSDPEKNYTISYPDGQLPLTHERPLRVSFSNANTIDFGGNTE